MSHEIQHDETIQPLTQDETMTVTGGDDDLFPRSPIQDILDLLQPQPTFPIRTGPLL
jgi:hypothetical protein